MSRTAELGRAVISLPSANLELWLTTLITVSPQQDSINLQDFDLSSLLDLLSSSSVWVGRGSGMHVEFDVSLRGEPMKTGLVQDLVKSILRAPVWNQLGLAPSLSENTAPKHGRVRIAIGYPQGDFEQGALSQPRAFSEMPPRGVKPPPGVPGIDLLSIRLSMDFVQVQQGPKRGRSGVGMTDSPSNDTEEAEVFDNGENEDVNLLLFEEHEGVIDVQQDSTQHPDQAHTLRYRKRKRKGPTEFASIRSNLPLTTCSSQQSDTRKPFSTNFNLQSLMHAPPLYPCITDLEILVDGALRLSVCRSSNRSRNGLKLKATTFTTGLAWIAPVLWRPGYLRALSERAPFVRVVGVSLGRMAHKKAKSMSLQTKLGRLTEPFSTTLPHVPLPDSSYSKFAFDSVSSRLWIYLQEQLPLKITANHLQPFCAPERQINLFSELENSPVQKDNEYQRRMVWR